MEDDYIKLIDHTRKNALDSYQLNKNIYHTDNEPDLTQLEDYYIPYDTPTPSELTGMTDIEEKKARMFINGLIQEAGIVLKLPQVVMLTAMNIFNRFYSKRSFTDIEPFYVACSSLMISTKLEENLRRLRDVITSCYFVLCRKDTENKPDVIIRIESDLYNTIKSNVIISEKIILMELGFCLYQITDHPHRYLLHFIRNIKGNKTLLEKSWNYCNDLYRTSLTVSFPPNVIAASSIYLAARKYYIPLPSVEWWKIYEVAIEDIQVVIGEVLELYEMRKVTLKEVRGILHKYSRIKQELDDLTNKRKLKDRKDKHYSSKEYKTYGNKYRHSPDRHQSSRRRRSRSRSRSRHRKGKSRYSRRSRSYSSSSSSSSSEIKLPTPKFNK